MYSESSNVINFVTGTVKRLRDNIRSKDGKPARMDDIRKGEFLECPQILENQIENITAYANKNGYGIDEVYSDIASGMNLDRKGFTKLLSAVMANEIEEVYISYKDRLARLDFGLVSRLFAQYGTKITVINSSENKTAEEELFEDLMSVTHSFSMKAYSKRRLAKKLLEGQDE